jgi:hypothetical protein
MPRDDDFLYWLCLKCNPPYVQRWSPDEEGPFFHYFDEDDPDGSFLKIQVEHELRRADR